MPEGFPIVFKTKEQITQQYLEEFQAAIPDVYIGEDGNLRIFIDVNAGVIEALFFGLQILHEDMFVQTANIDSLRRYGVEYGVEQKAGTRSVGELLFSGAGGTFIDVGAEAAHDPDTGEDILYFRTTEAGTIPNPGIPTAPTAADAGAGTLAAGTYEYAVTFQTVEGETEIGDESNAVAIAINRNINLTNIPLGGPGTTARNLYERIDGGAWAKVTDAAIVAELANNTDTAVTVAAGTRGGTPPESSTAEQIRLAAESDDFGTRFNAVPGTITQVVDVPDGVNSVTNPVDFTGGSDEESLDEFRDRLLEELRTPKTGSVSDLKSWAESFDAVESAAVFENDNLGVAANGHTTIRISGPGGAVPTAETQQEVYDFLRARDIANITLHVTTFTPVLTDVTVTVELEDGFILADVDEGVTNAISDYINSLAAGETLYIAGLISEVFELPGIKNVTVDLPLTDLTTNNDEKRVPDTIIVQV